MANTKKSEDTENNTSETLDHGKLNNNADGATQAYFDEQGAKSKANRGSGGEDVKVSLTNTTLVRFTKDHGYMKKGDEQLVSDQAYAIYEKAGVIEKI